PDPLTQSWKAERVFLELLDKANEQHINISVNPTARNYAPKMFASEAMKQGVKKRDLVDAMQRMLDSGKIETVPYGYASQSISSCSETKCTELYRNPSRLCLDFSTTSLGGFPHTTPHPFHIFAAWKFFNEINFPHTLLRTPPLNPPCVALPLCAARTQEWES